MLLIIYDVEETWFIVCNMDNLLIRWRNCETVKSTPDEERLEIDLADLKILSQDWEFCNHIVRASKGSCHSEKSFARYTRLWALISMEKCDWYVMKYWHFNWIFFFLDIMLQSDNCEKIKSRFCFSIWLTHKHHNRNMNTDVQAWNIRSIVLVVFSTYASPMLFIVYHKKNNPQSIIILSRNFKMNNRWLCSYLFV